MSPRARRLLGVALAVALALVIGRAVVEFLAARWWSSAISEPALRTVAHWQWLGLGLDVAAVIVASLWFVCHALLVARAIASVQVQHQVGDLSVRELVPTRLLVVGAIATGVLLGVIAGTGAAAWREPIALAWQGVSYGVNEPILGHDIGFYLTSVPLWQLAQGFAFLLVALGLGFIATLYIGVGGLKLVGARRPALHPYARRHLGGLLTLLALVFGWGYLLEPYDLVLTKSGLLGAAAIDTRIVAAYAMAGVSLAVGIMTLRWALVARRSLFVAGWTVLAVAALGERVIVPAFVAETPRTTADLDTERQMVELAYGIEATISPTRAAEGTGPVEHDIWDTGLLANIAAGAGNHLLFAEPIAGAGGLPWRILVMPGNDPDRVWIRTVSGDSVSPLGLPIDLTDPIGLTGVISTPGQAGWRPATGAVELGSVLRRAALAWALQAPGIFSTSANTIDWGLDPVTRVTELMPALSWQLAGVAGVTGAEQWLLLGFATMRSVPFGVPSSLQGQIVEGVVPAVIAAVAFRTGDVTAWVDPAADSLGQAWARVYQPLVTLQARLPGEIGAALPYSGARLQAQVTALKAVSRELGTANDAVAPRHSRGTPAVAVQVGDAGKPAPLSLIVGQRNAGMPRLAIHEIGGAGLGAAELKAAWRATPELAHISDSLHASGDTVLAGPLRRAASARGLESWQVFASAGRRGPARVLWIGTSVDGSVDGGSRPQSAWANGDDGGTAPVRIDAAVRLEAVRDWIRRADSALARGDMTAFGRAWEALRALMQGGAPK